ncbi:multifunctional nuclease/2',3'-cyclic-nucleotide 2'-phosphodiesterase/5'-nucleotidase/3'-nucleotidase [Salinibacterium xinjiangense]|uniref:5'-nucleotidase n=1 Tax=Salinibacterium xinjiangense TaxID=386302 RepID=A0A2C8Z404_9MICO|nr:ExeM/NucH family extracellular endonuclease [Salinibacterium xinjiangense]GGK93758.1 multifunctional nuclease/2',3'-cyclic-nucleotide 2'-phosphodiesterase/5'-nucleotidase/3'-nucleotidase [Salinibacterium xinjiangense]SOE58430.1 5'-nucleotidase [Salinibacterium xinjiangense]
MRSFTPQPEKKLPSRPHRRMVAVATATALALVFTSLTAVPATAADVTATIADVQGTTDVTPLSGSVVTVQGVVTGDYRNSTASGYRGFYLQDPVGDAADNRSDGIFVFSATANPAVSIGDLITVTGAASEFNGQTQISATTDAAYGLVTAGVGVPASTVLPDAAVGNAREAFEGMLVTPESAYLSSSHQLFNFGSLWLNVGGLAVKATETTDAGVAANVIAAGNRANRLLVDDGYSIQVSNAAHSGTQPYFDTATVVRNGDRFVSPAAGMILGWGFSDWRLQPQRPLSSTSPAEYAAFEPTFESLNPRTNAPIDVGGDFSVGAFNVFNYFTTFGGNARGADNAADFTIQQSKIVSAINALDADVVALMEIENSVKLGEPADEALGNLVDALNAAAGSTVWAFVPTPAPLLDAATTDFITNAIIYKTATATPVGASMADIDETVWNIAREPIAQTFEVDGKVITVVANHFKSKSPPSGGGAEPSDLQGFFNAERVAQANRVKLFVDGIIGDPAKGPNVMLLGDFNAYHEEDPSQVLTAAGFVDLVPDNTDEYTYTFNGELGSLDHAFASPALAESVTGVDVWNINSSEWSDRGYEFDAAEAGTPFRSSDHDPVKIGLSSALPPVNIDLVSINDFHGRLEASGSVAGAAVLAGTVNKYRAANPNTAFVGAGDLIGASTFTSFIQNDQPTIDAFNAMGLDASALGNHEFDQGRADLDNRILPAASWDYLSANLFDKATGEAAYDEYSIETFGDVTIGFVGATTDELSSLVSPAGIASLEIRPVVPEVNRVADALSDGDPSNGEADVIVLLVHEGAATTNISSATDDSAFGRIVNGTNANVNAIISGHTHLAYNHLIPITGTDTLRPVISSGQYGEKFAHSAISVDPKTGELLSFNTEVLNLAGAAAPDPAVAAIVADAVAVAKVLGAVKVGDITASFTRARQTAGAENRGGESTLGNFVADVQLEATKEVGADIAFMNPGGLRADLTYASTGANDPDGNVTFAEAAAVQPFANTLVTKELTGAQLKAVLEQQWQPAAASRPFLKLGVSEGFEYTYVVNPIVAGTPVTGTVTGMSLNGVAIAPTDVFTVTVNSFLASGGDNFGAFGAGTNPTDSGKIDLQSMVDYFEAKPVASPDSAQRAVGVSLSAPDADGYSSGDQVTLSLSSLLFSTSAPRAGTAVVSAGNVELGRAAIDPAIVDTTDESGRASVAITIPAGTPAGILVLTVSVPEAGTSIEVPITVTAVATVIENVMAPVISGKPKIGRTLTATGGTWSVESPTLAFQWNRNGTAISSATAASYTLVAADAGAKITVTVTASKAGSLDGAATSAEVSVPKGKSSTSGSTNRTVVFGNQPVTYTVTVRGDDGVVPTGEVAIYDGTRKITTVTLTAADNGRITVPVSLGRGIHLLTARYLGSDTLEGSIGSPDPVIRF